MHILRNMYITYAYMCIIYEKNEVRRILPSTCKQNQNMLANNFVRSLKSFTDPITLVRYFLFCVYSGNCKADMYYISPNNAQNLKYNSQYAVNLPALLYKYDNLHKLFKQVLAVTLTKIFVATKMQMFEFFCHRRNLIPQRCPAGCGDCAPEPLSGHRYRMKHIIT